MYSIMLLAAIAGLATVGTLIYRGDRNIGVLIFIPAFGTLVGSVVGSFVGMGFGEFVPMRDVADQPKTLVAMRSADSFSGTFLWGSGNIGSQVNYHFMLRMEDGSLVPHTVPANTLVHLIEDPELKDVGYWRTFTRKPIKTSALYKWAIVLPENKPIVRQEFRVPKGTVVQQFKVQ